MKEKLRPIAVTDRKSRISAITQLFNGTPQDELTAVHQNRMMRLRWAIKNGGHPARTDTTKPGVANYPENSCRAFEVLDAMYRRDLHDVTTNELVNGLEKRPRGPARRSIHLPPLRD
jgi:hypothetical protein